MKNLDEKLAAAAGHTPGPWIVSDIYPADVYAKDSTTGRGRCVSTGVDIRGGNVCNTAEDRANAALIAAAPDMAARIKELEEINAGMLAALENLLAEFVHVPGDTEGNKDRTTAARIIGGPNAALARAREAIEKAKGISTSAAESPTWEDKAAAAIAAIVYADTPEERDAAIKKAEGLVD